MTPEIEKRIKAVQAGRVPAGYKRTKVGIVPKEWDELKLSHYLSVSKEKNTELKYSKEDVFSISGELGIVNQIELLGRSYAGVSVAPYGVVKPNDVVYTKSPLKANPYGIIKTNKTGKTGIVSTLYAIFNCKNNVNPFFVQYYFESDKNLNDYLHPIVNIGAKHDMKISDENSLSGIVVFPPLLEQKKIAEILVTQDRVVELKKKLVAEKLSQKKYLMSVFFDERKKMTKKTQWTAIRIEDIFEESSEKNHPDADVLTIIQGVGTVSREQSGREIIYDKNALSTYKFVKEGDFIIHLRSFEGGLEAANSDGIVSPAYIILRPKIDVSTKYLYALFHTNRFINQTMAPSVEGARDGRSVKYEVLKKQKINLPSLPEQKAVANVLSAADEEIFLLQKDLEQEKLKKKSLMQLLLTGLVRVQ